MLNYFFKFYLFLFVFVCVVVMFNLSVFICYFYFNIFILHGQMWLIINAFSLFQNIITHIYSNISRITSFYFSTRSRTSSPAEISSSKLRGSKFSRIMMRKSVTRSSERRHGKSAEPLWHVWLSCSFTNLLRIPTMLLYFRTDEEEGIGGQLHLPCIYMSVTTMYSYDQV